MVSEKHKNLLSKMIKEHELKGFRISPIHKNIFGYRPDMIMENDSEVIILEAVVTNDHNPLIPSLFNGKKVRFIKEYDSLPDVRTIRLSLEGWKWLKGQRVMVGGELETLMQTFSRLRVELVALREAEAQREEKQP